MDPHALAVRRPIRCPWDVGPAPHVLAFVAASWGPAVWGVRQTEWFRCETCPRVLVIVEGKYADCVAENNEYRRAAHPTSDPADNSLNRAKLRTETMLDDPAAGCSICGAKKPAFCAHAVIPDPATGAAVELANAVLAVPTSRREYHMGGLVRVVEIDAETWDQLVTQAAALRAARSGG